MKELLIAHLASCDACAEILRDNVALITVDGKLTDEQIPGVLEYLLAKHVGGGHVQ